MCMLRVEGDFWNFFIFFIAQFRFYVVAALQIGKVFFIVA